jgi:hypothetical protein
MFFSNFSIFYSFGLSRTFVVADQNRIPFAGLVDFYSVQPMVFSFFSKAEFFRLKNFFFKKKTNKVYSIRLFLKGVGYKVLKPVPSIYKGYFKLDLGFSVILYIKVPYYIKVRHARDKLILFSFNNSKLNSFAKFVQSLRFPDVYKGKGVRYASLPFIPKPGKQR